MIFTDLFSKDMCHVCGQTPCNCTHIAESVAEGTGNIGPSIKTLFQKIYDQGDDEIEYFYYESPVFAQYWDKYEGDIDSIVAEVDPKELQIIHDELEAYVEGAGLAEEKVRLDPKCWKGKKIGNPKTKMKGGVRVNNCVPAEGVEENYDNGEYSDEAGMAHGNLITIAKAARGLLDTIDQHEDLPEWVQEKIAKVEGMLVSAWNYLQSQEAQGIDPRVSEMYANLAENWQRVSHRLELNQEFDMIESIVESIARRNGVDAETVWADLESLTEDELYVFAVTSEPIMEDWQKANKRDKTDGMSRKAVKAYRREHPGSKLQTAVTTKPSKLKKGSKASKRRKSYCSRSRGQMKMHNISCAKTPDKAICKARRRWNCEGVDRSNQTVVAEGSGYDGSGPLDLSKNPSVNDVFKRALYIHDYEGYGNNMDYSEDEAIDHYVERKFGQDVLNQLNKARYHSYFGREGGNKGGHIRSSNLGQASAPVGRFRTTKAGKMHGQDAKIMKGKVADRLGRHPAPTLPEGVAEMDSQGYKGTRDEGDPYAKGGKATPVKSKDVVQQGVKALNKAHPDYSQHEKKLIGKMSNAEKVNKGWRNPNIDEGSGNIGRAIKSLFQKIYDQGDDEVEYFYYESPVFAQYWDQYEGDIDSIIAEVDPAELQIIHDELEAYAEGAGLVEGETTRTPTGLIHRATDKYGAGDEPFNPHNPGKYVRDLDSVNKQQVKDLDASMGINWKSHGPKGIEVDEVSDATLTSYLTKVDADARKHKADPTKRSAEKANRSVAGFARAFNKLDARKEKTDEVKQKAVPSGQRDPGALATRSHIASQEKAHSDWATRQKALADEFYRNHPELDDRPKPVAENSMADELARIAMKISPKALVRKDGEVMQHQAPGPKPAGTTDPRPAPKFDPEAEYADDYSAWHRRTHGVKEDANDIVDIHRKLTGN